VLHPADRTRDAISAGVALSVADLDAETSHELVSGAVILVRSNRLNLLDTLVCKSGNEPGVWLGVYMSSVATLNAKGGRIRVGWTIGWKDKKKDDVELLIGPEVLARDEVQGLVVLCGAITRHPRYDPVSKGRLNVYLTEEELMRDDGT